MLPEFARAAIEPDGPAGLLSSFFFRTFGI